MHLLELRVRCVLHMTTTATKRDYSRLDKFIEERFKDVYDEPNLNSDFIDGAIESIENKISMFDSVLDVGCGWGYALKKFSDMGCKPIGITLCESDASKARAYGYDVHIMDMNFMDFEDQTFNVVFARHSLEHSLFPYFTLSEFSRVMKPKGLIYLEMPAPDTDANHCCNAQHYTVLNGTAWANLIFRTGFQDIESYIIDFELSNCGRPGEYDRYYRFIARKP